MIYLTYAEPPSGVYESQVTDVIRFMNEECDAGIRLVAFISLRSFGEKRKWIKEKLPDAVVLPMLPKATWWRFNIFFLALLCFFIRPKSILARNVIAANMALQLKKFGLIKKVGFDGRGAIAAEWKEYDVQVDPSWKKEIANLEKNAVIYADARLGVSAQLILYWKKEYGYQGKEHVVIPCTLNSDFSTMNITPDSENFARRQYGYSPDDIILAYSGSTAGWQSFQLVKPFLQHYLKKDPRYKALFLAKDEANIRELRKEFPDQVQQLWAGHLEVPSVLAACDLGILIREQSVTNRVASPTKFAEYLAAGLPVAISENLGDYSEFVVNQNCGFIVTNPPYPEIDKTTFATRKRLNQLVIETSTKHACKTNYRRLLDLLKV
jgi:glycosyltransferase involved in cell wall biosynthesis